MRKVAVILCFLITSLAAWFVVSNSKDKSAPPQSPESCVNMPQKAVKGQCAPDFTLQTFKGDESTLYKSNNKPTLMVFWTSWCPSCKDQMKHLAKLYPKYRDKINFLLVNVTSADKEQDAREYVRKNNYDMPFLLDPQGRVSNDLYHIQGYPTSFALNRIGKIVNMVPGSMTEEQLQKLLQELSE